MNKFKEKLKGGFKKRIIAGIVATAVIITSVNLTDIAGDSNKDVSRENRKLTSFAEEVAELTVEDTYEGNSRYQTKRLIVTAENDSFNTFGATDTINYGDIFVLAYETEEACENARKNLLKEDGVKSVEIDAVMEIETKKVSDDDIEKAMKISSYSDNDKKPHELLDNYDSFNINDMEEGIENNVDTYIKEKKLQQKNDVVVAIIDSGADKSAIAENRFIDSQKNFSGEGESDDITDNNGHGSQMAEIISSQTGDSVKIMPVKVANKDGKCSILSAYLGVKYASENGADVINISMNTVASAKSEVLENAIREASKKGITVSVSAGNSMDNAKFYTPGNIKEAFVISATDKNGTLAGYSNFGETVDYVSSGIHGDSEGTSIAAANFAASAAKLKSAGVKNIESAMDKIAGFEEKDDKKPEQDFFLGRGYIGNKRVITGPKEDDGKNKVMVTGVAPAIADIRNLEGDKWKELSQEELEYYIRNSSYVNVGAFLTSLNKNDLKKIVNSSEDLRKQIYVYREGKLYRKLLKYEDMIRCYSEQIDSLSTSNDSRPLQTSGSKPVVFGIYDSEKTFSYADNLSYFTITNITLTNSNLSDNGGLYLVNVQQPVTVSIQGPDNKAAGIIISNPVADASGKLQKTDSNGSATTYAAVYGTFTASIPNYYANANNKNIDNRHTKKDKIVNGTRTTVENPFKVRLNFNDKSDAETTVWGADTNGRQKTCSWQCNIANAGIELYFTKDGAREWTCYDNSTIENTEKILAVERPLCAITPVIDSTSIYGIDNPTIYYRKGENITPTADNFGVTVKDGYDPSKIHINEGNTAAKYEPILENKTPSLFADPMIYKFNYYNNMPAGMTKDDTQGDPVIREIAFNSQFTWEPSTLFSGHYNLTYKAIPLSTEENKPTVNEGESFGIRQFERNDKEWETVEETYNGNTVLIDKYNPSTLKEKDFTVTDNTIPTGSEKVTTSVDKWVWNTSIKTPGNSEKNEVASNRDIYASWDNGKYPLLHTPSMTGFDFKGWYTSRSYDSKLRGYNGSGHQVKQGENYSQVTDQTLYGRWERKHYTITYDYGKNGGYLRGNTEKKIKTGEQLYDWPVEIPMDAEKSKDEGSYTQEQKNNNLAPGVYSGDNPDGWEFIGWSEDPDAKVGGSSKIYGIADNEGQKAYKKKENEKYVKDEYGRYVSTSFWESSTDPEPEDYITDEFYMPARNVTLYAIYRKTLKFTATCSLGNIRDPEQTMLAQNITKELYGNEHSIEITVPEIRPAYFGLSTEGAKKYTQWETLGWSENTEPVEKVEYDKTNYGNKKIISKNYALYAIYQRELNANFVSYESNKQQIKEGEYQKTETIQGTQLVNACNIEKTTGVNITVPSAYKYEIDLENGTWSQDSWIHEGSVKQYNDSTEYIQDADILREQGKFGTNGYTQEEYENNKNKQSSVLIKNNSKITIYHSETYYALYDRDIHVLYTHYRDNERVSEEKQPVRQYAISNDKNYSTPPVILKKIGNYDEWPRACHWSTSNTGLIQSYPDQDKDKSVVINIKETLKLYGIYERDIQAKFVYYKDTDDPSCKITDTVTETQRGNAYDFDSTKEDVSFRDPGIPSFNDSRRYTWTGQYWSTSKTESKNAQKDISTNPFTIRDTTTFYAIYNTLYVARFASIKGSLQDIQTRSGYAWLNANDISKKSNPVVVAPEQAKCDIRSKTWTALGWTKSTNTTDLSGENAPFNKDTSITLTENTDFYGIYDTKFNINFVDYDGSTQKTSQETATQMVNSYDRHPSSPVLTAPNLHTCTLDGKTWNAVGWSPAVDTFIADKQAGDTISVDNASTFYGIYSTDVTLNFVAYRTSENPPAQTGRVYMNSANSANRKKASAAITNPRNSDVWTGIGWTTSTNKGASVEVSTGNTFEYDRDTTLYGLYKRDIYIKYKLNDGTDNEYGGDPQKAEIQVNAYDTSKISPAMATIISGSPSRGSFQFMGVWGNTSMNPTAKYIPGSVHAFSEDTTLYAQWELPTIDKTITIQWEDGNNLNKTRPAAVWLELYRDGVLVTSHLVSSADNVAKPSGNKIIGAEGTKVDTSGTGNEFKYTYKELQKYSPEDGHAYSYTVKEKPVESLVNGLMYTITYPSSDVVKNILANSDGIQMNMEINWDDGLNAWHIRPSMVYVSLLRTDPDTHEEKVVKTASIRPAPEAETQVYSFNNVEVMNASKHLYTYRVKLNPIPGYSTTYGELTDRDGVPTFPVYNVCTGLPTLYGENYIIFSADAFCSNGNMATGKDYLNIDATDYDPVLITLRQVHKVWSGTGADATESYENNKYMHNDVNNTDISYNVIVSPHVDTKLVKIPYGRYELDMHENALFDLTKFNAANSEKINASLDTINGKQYVTFSAKHSSGAIAKLHANLLIANWRGYTTIQSRYQPLDHTVVTARMPGNYDNFGYLKKTWNLMKIDKEIILNDDGTIFKMNPDFGIDGELVMDKKVQKLEAEAFSGQKNLVKLTLPNNLKRVDGNAFKNCSQLRIVTYLGVQYTTNSALKEAFRRNGVTFEESAFEGVALGY